MTYSPLTLSKSTENELKRTIELILAPGKGILPADEAVPDLGAKLEAIGLKNTEENRRQWREILVDGEPDLSKYISGMILGKEMFYQKTSKGEAFVEVLKKRGIAVGINIANDIVPLPFTNDTVVDGLDNLLQRVQRFKADGAMFAKWRVAYEISAEGPSMLAIQDNAISLARYAAACQAYGIVPIVEPDVVLTGDYDIVQSRKVYEIILAHVYKALKDYNVYVEGTLLKTAFITPGSKSERKASSSEVAVATIQTLQRTVPAAVPGVVFLSGGHSEDVATAHLQAVIQQSKKDYTNTKQSKCPWVLTYCYGRAVLFTAWKSWKGKSGNAAQAKKDILNRAKINSMAAL